MIQRIPKINIPATIAMCATFAMSACLVHLFGPARVRPFCGMDVLPSPSSSIPTGMIRYQADAPIRFTGLDTTNPSRGFALIAKNVSGRPITGYALVYSRQKNSSSYTSVSSFVSSTDLPTCLDVNGTYSWALSSDLVGEVWVDFVEFSDGTIWGQNTSRTLESMNAYRMGTHHAALKYSRVLRTRGPQAMLESIPEPVANTQLNQYDDRRRSSFASGVESVCERLLQDKSNVEMTMNSQSPETRDAALAERFKQTLSSYTNFRRQ